MDGRIVLLMPVATLRFDSLGFVYTGPTESVAGCTFARPPCSNVLTGVAGRETFVRGFSDEIIIGMLGPNPTQESFRLAAYYLTDLAFQASRAEPLAWGEFMERYTAMYPHGQPGLPDDPVTSYVNNLSATGAAPGSTTTRRAQTMWQRDPMRECNVCVASTSSSSKPEPTPCHRAADAQRRARLDELAEARRRLDEELALLHQELGVDLKPHDRQPAQDIPVHEQPVEGNGDWREHRPGLRTNAAGMRAGTRQRSKHNEGANADANADAPPLFRRASQNLAAAVLTVNNCIKVRL
jgi:hypothetical protein